MPAHCTSKPFDCELMATKWPPLARPHDATSGGGKSCRSPTRRAAIDSPPPRASLGGAACSGRRSLAGEAVRSTRS